VTIHYQNDDVTVYHGDCTDVLAELADSSIDAIVTDPPYLLGFMGRQWDTKTAHEHLDWHHTWAVQSLRVLKPGGHIVAFGGTRTWHRLACAVEDAGFEIRDNLAWLYGSGFPKSLDVSKAIDKAAGAEREVVGEHPWAHVRGDGSAIKTGVYDGGAESRRGPTSVTAPATDAAKQWQGWGTALKPAFEPIILARKPFKNSVAQNVQTHSTGALNIDACRVDLKGDYKSKPNGRPSLTGLGDNYEPENANIADTVGRWPANVLLDETAAAELDKQSGQQTSGTASRFFSVFKYTAKAPGVERPTVGDVSHPTVKPVELMRWLVKLVAPPHGLVLDPFAGTGTTGEACVHEHMRCVLIEREADYLPLIKARLSKPMQIGFDFDA
jgi:site-specific DNA-methyltransferase (adenine-specific)